MSEQAQVPAEQIPAQGEQAQTPAQPTMAQMLAAKEAEKAEQKPVTQQVPGESPSEPAEPVNPLEEKQELDPENLAVTGDAVLDAGIAMMQKVAGLNSADVERILSTAFERGDASLVDSAYIKERFPEHAAYVEQLAHAYIEKTTARVNALVSKIHEQAGGPEQWDLLNSTFQQHAPAHLQKSVQALADTEDFETAAQIIMEFSRNSGLVPVAGQHIQGGGAIANGALSAAGFKEEMSKLRAEAGSRSLESGPLKARYDTLVRRRQAGRMQGL